MNASDTIPILIEKPAAASPSYSYSNSLPLLHEIAHALRRLHLRGKPTVLDLNAIPFGPEDERRLLDFLGQGEVSATLETMGSSQVRESKYPGVWLIEHRSSGGERVAFQIEITKLPRILESQPEDIGEALSTLQSALEDLQTGDPV